MPRGIRNPVNTINEKIAEIDAKISNYQKRISKLSTQKKELLASKEKAELDALYKAIKQSGKDSIAGYNGDLEPGCPAVGIVYISFSFFSQFVHKFWVHYNC